MQQGWRQADRPELSGIELDIWRDFIDTRCGTYFTDSRVRYLTRCLWQRMQALGMSGYGEYYRHVAFNPEGSDEWDRLLELLVNRETGFFRHLPSFQAVAQRVLPELRALRARHGIRELTAWSAGCSTGQEAYSLAMVLREGLAGSDWSLKVCGSDVSAAALEEARRGLYRAAAAQNVPAEYRSRYLRAKRNCSQVYCEVIPELRAVVEFGQLNLNQLPSYWVGQQDIIFCQNVLIYFRPERRVEIAHKLCGKLKPRGYLFLAPGELVGLKIPGVRFIQFESSLAYQRID